MKKRLGMAAFIAALIGGWALSLFELPWYRVGYDGVSIPAKLEDFHGGEIIPQIVGMLITIYFFARLMFTGILVLLGGPTSTRKIAWYTPLRAHVQGGFALAAVIVAVVWTPKVKLGFADAYATIERSWGPWLALACTVLAHVAIHLIKRDPELARTQTWPADEEPRYVPKRKQRWIHSEPQERPLVKSPPLAQGASVDAVPFREAPPVGLAANLVKPETKSEAPRADDSDAPGPKLLR